MRKYWRRVINLLALGIVNCFYIAAPAIGADVIKFALPGNSMGYLPLFVAVHRGFFKDEGLEIELPRLIPAMAQNAPNRPARDKQKAGFQRSTRLA